jgi:SHAQKYF class myb-like DNA-binding protein
MHRNTRHCEVRGVWSADEHERFLDAMAMYPIGPWKLITDHVGTRSIKQVQTHAQKYQQKLKRQQRGLRKQKTKVSQPEHRVDATTRSQFTHESILRYAQRRVKEQAHDDWTSVLSDDWKAESPAYVDVDLMDLIPNGEMFDKAEEEEDDDDEIEVPRFDAMYDPPSDWNVWQLEDLLQPTPIDMMLAIDKGGHPDGSELPLLECTI